MFLEFCGRFKILAKKILPKSESTLIYGLGAWQASIFAPFMFSACYGTVLDFVGL